jgi:hypothetical protein
MSNPTDLEEGLKIRVLLVDDNPTLLMPPDNPHCNGILQIIAALAKCGEADIPA